MNSDTILVIGSFDCNDHTNTILESVKLSVGQPQWSELGGPGVDIASQVGIDDSALVESVFGVRISGSDGDDLEARLNSLRAELAKETNTAAFGLKGRSSTVEMRLCRNQRIDAVLDPHYVSSAVARIEVHVWREPWCYGAVESVCGANQIVPASPTGSTFPTEWTRVGEDANLVVNPQFGVNVTDGWVDTLTDVVVTRDTSPGVAFPVSGIDACVKLDYTYAGTARDLWADPFIAVSASTTYRLSAYFYVPTLSGGGYVCGFCSVYNGGSWVRDVAMTSITTANAGFVRYDLTVTIAASGETHLRPSHQVNSASSVSYSTGWMVQKNTVNDYFDGSFADCRWAGTAHNSASYLQLCTASGDKFTLDDNGTAQADYATVTSPEVAVVPGRRYGVGSQFEVPVAGGASFAVGVRFYDAAHASLGSAVSFCSASIVLADGWRQGTYVAPANAAYARFLALLTKGTTTTTGIVYDVEFGEQLVQAPDLMDIDAQTGQAPYPLDLLVTSQQEMTSFYAGVYPAGTVVTDDLVIALGGHADWVDGTGTHTDTTDTTGYPDGAGNTVTRAASGTAYIDIDVAGLEEGTYLMLARCKGTTASTDSIRHAYCDDILIPTTALAWLSLGYVSLPTNVVYGAGASTIRLTITGTGAAEWAYVNAVAFVPVSFGGMVGWKPATGHAHSLRFEDGVLYVDGVTDLSAMIAGPTCKALGDHLLVVSETANPLADLDITVSGYPRWEQFPS